MELKIYVDHLTGIICAYGAIGKCVMKTIFFLSPSQEDFFYCLLNTGVCVIMLPNNVLIKIGSHTKIVFSNI